MFGELFCKDVDVPCDRPKGKGFATGGPFPGLTGLDIWWKERLTEDQKWEYRHQAVSKLGYSSTMADLKAA